MIEFLIGVSIVLLVLAILCYGHSGAFVVVVGGFSCLSGLLIFVLAPWLLTIHAGVFLAWGICRRAGWPRRRFSGVAALAIVGGWGIAMWQFVPHWREIQTLAQDFPVQKIDQRLAYERSPEQGLSQAKRGEPVSEVVEDETYRLATEIYDRAGHWRSYDDRRTQALVTLHKTHTDFVTAFARQRGFGTMRMPIGGPARDEYIRIPEPGRLALNAPPRLSVSAGADLESDWRRRDEVGEEIREWHAGSVANFSNADAFGYIIGQNAYEMMFANGTSNTQTIRTRGFQSHGFQSVPADSLHGEAWQLARVDLVSLLKHDPPAVYLTAALPRMEELASEDVPTRKLDSFETKALDHLNEGEVIVVRQGRNRIRMLGAILATRQCVQCHFVSQGEMLGAFSYEFRRKQPIPANDQPTRAKPPLL